MEREAPDRDVPGVIAPPPLVFLAGLAVGFALEALLPSADLPGPLGPILGAVLILAGAALLLSFVREFNAKETAVEPWRETTAIVTDGPYRFTRNPGYLGMALVYAGIALASECLWVLAPLPFVLAVIDRGVIAREERYLERKFGEDYLGYKRRVRRWV